MTENRVIGRSGTMPWHLPADMRHFVEHTQGKSVIMGRRSYQAIGRPLPRRHNIVMTRDPAFTAAGCTIAATPHEALAAAEIAPEIMVIGGEQIYALFLPLAHRIELTLIATTLPGDTRFPSLDANWQVVSERHHSADGDNRWNLTFQRLERAR